MKHPKTLVRTYYRTSARRLRRRERSRGREGQTLDKGRLFRRCVIRRIGIGIFTSFWRSNNGDSVQILKQDPEAREKAPEVMKEELDSSTSTQASMSFESEEREVEKRGHKFGLPELPLPSNAHLKHRYDPIVEQVTNLMMRDGKKSVAQRVGPSVNWFLQLDLSVSTGFASPPPLSSLKPSSDLKRIPSLIFRHSIRIWL